MAKSQTDLVPGTLDLLILKTLELEPRHGVAIADRIAQVTRGTFSVKPGSLFPALHRLEQHGSVTGEWTTTAGGHRAKVYRITGAGQRQLAIEMRQWSRVVLAIAMVLEPE